MSHLHRFLGRDAARIWELESRWMRAEGTFRAPAAAQWIATRACDLTCAHCYSHAGPRAADELSTDEALAMVDALADTGCEQLVIAGGEPLLRKDLDLVVERAVGRGLRWAVHTHGGLVRQRASLFERFPPSLAAISLDGPEALHDRLRGRAGSFRDALAAIAWLRGTACPMVVAGTTVNRENADTLADLLPVVQASGAHSWGLHLFAPEGRGAEHRALLPTPAQLRRAAGFALRARAVASVDLDNEWGSAGELDPLYRDEPFLCGAGRFTFVIAANGDLMPCTTTDPAEAEGNVRTHDLREVWRTGFSRFRGGEEPPRPGRSGASVCGDGADCWLQTRNGNSCREAAFGARPAPARLPDVLPPPPPRSRARGALRWAAALALAAVAPASASPPEPLDATAADALPPDFDPGAWFAHHPTAGRALPVGPGPAVRAALEPGPRPLAVLVAALDEAEAASAWDAGLVAELYGRAPTGADPGLPAFYARLERHARVAQALVLARAEVGEPTYLPWRKKSAPPAGHLEVGVPPGFTEAARGHLGRPSTWTAEVTVDLALTAGTARLHRAGRVSTLSAGDRVRLGRLDLVELDGVLAHAALGPVASGSGVAVHARGVDGWLAVDARRQLEPLVAAALSGDEPAIDRVTGLLPLAHGVLRAAVADRPDARGAPAVRQALVLFDR